MKACSKCKIEYPATAKYFGPDKRASDGFKSQCRVCRRAYYKEYQRSDKGKARQHRYYKRNKDKIRACQKEYQQSDKGRAGGKKAYEVYYATLNGHLNRVYHNMTTRCVRQESYTNKGIRNNFESPDDLIDYVTNVLKVDPRGLHCHRPDNDGHYERGNIEFLTEKEHIEKHSKIFCGVAVADR